MVEERKTDETNFKRDKLNRQKERKRKNMKHKKIEY